jgi:hypothetical protein
MRAINPSWFLTVSLTLTLATVSARAEGNPSNSSAFGLHLIPDATSCLALPSLDEITQDDFLKEVRIWSLTGFRLPDLEAKAQLLVLREVSGVVEVHGFEFEWNYTAHPAPRANHHFPRYQDMCSRLLRCGRLSACAIARPRSVNVQPVWEYLESRGLWSSMNAESAPSPGPRTSSWPRFRRGRLLNTVVVETARHGEHQTLISHPSVSDPDGTGRLTLEVMAIGERILWLLLDPHFDRHWATLRKRRK